MSAVDRMKVSKKTAFALAGISWSLIGLFLLYKGMTHIYASLALQLYGNAKQPLLHLLASILPSYQSALLTIVICALALGYLKGFTVLRKSAMRVINSVMPYGGKVPLHVVFPLWYIAVIGAMMLLSMAMTLFGLPLDLRGFIDLGVAFALINGSAFYFRQIAEMAKRA